MKIFKKVQNLSSKKMQPQPQYQTNIETLSFDQRSACSSSVSGSTNHKSNTSSGYCSNNSNINAQCSAKSIYFNLNNYFYDENFSSLKISVQQNNKESRNNTLQSFMENECEFLSTIKQSIEQYVRPLSCVLDTEKYFAVFQNIEKLNQLSEFLRNSIQESMEITHDLFVSSLNVTHDYLSMISSSYSVYIKGYKKANVVLEKCASTIRKVYSGNQILRELQSTISLPIKHLTSMYSAFASLKEMTQTSESHEYERLVTICAELKQLLGPFQSELSLLSIEEEEESECLSYNDLKYDSKIQLENENSKNINNNFILNDYIDNDGIKYYYL